MDNKQKVLREHKRKGKLLQPPLSQIGVMSEASWKERTLPELLWIGLVFHCHGVQEGVELTHAVAKEADKFRKEGAATCFAFTSPYGALSSDEKFEILERLRDEGKQPKLAEALAPLATLYPEFPLSFLCEPRNDMAAQATSDREFMRSFIDPLYRKRDRLPVLMQAQVVYIMGSLGRLVVQKGSALGDLNSLSDYPDTEESKVVGATVCATCNGFIGVGAESEAFDWPKCFWERNFSEDNCVVDLPYSL